MGRMGFGGGTRAIVFLDQVGCFRCVVGYGAESEVEVSWRCQVMSGCDLGSANKKAQRL